MRRLAGVAHPSNSRRGKMPITHEFPQHNRKAGNPRKDWRHKEARRKLRSGLKLTFLT